MASFEFIHDEIEGNFHSEHLVEAVYLSAYGRSYELEITQRL